MDEDQIVFYSKSASAEPFKGVHEYKHSNLAYAALHAIYKVDPDFRRKFSNFHIGEFKFEGRTYRTIEHAFHAEKFRAWARLTESTLERNAAIAAAEQFALESGSDLSKGDGSVAQKARKAVVINDPSFFQTVWTENAGLAMRRMEDIARAKYNTHGVPEIDAAREVLKATNPANLVHLMKIRGKSSELVRFVFLEKIRAELLGDEEWHGVVKRARLESDVAASSSTTLPPPPPLVRSVPGARVPPSAHDAALPADVLRRDGVVVVNVLDMPRVVKYETAFMDMHWPEFQQNAPTPYVMGGFGAYGHASSFHHRLVRELRRIVKQELIDKVFRAYAPGKNLEGLFDRLCERHKDYGLPNKESWHQDVCNVVTPADDEIFGGWLNLDSNYTQTFICLKGSQGTIVPSGKMFERVVDSNKSAEYDKNHDKVEVPPGHAILIKQGLLHAVFPRAPTHRSFRLFHGFRITSETQCLFNGNRTTLAGKPLTVRTTDWIERLGVPLLPSGQPAPMYAPSHVNFHSEKIDEFAKKMRPEFVRVHHGERRLKKDEQEPLNVITKTSRRKLKEGEIEPPDVIVDSKGNKYVVEVEKYVPNVYLVPGDENRVGYPLTRITNLDRSEYRYSAEDVAVLSPQPI